MNTSAGSSRILQENFTYTTRSLPSTRLHTIAKISSGTIISFVTLLGNSISLLVFIRTKTLRKKPYLLLVNLCTADLLVGLSVAMRVALDVCYLQGWATNYSFASLSYTLDYFSSLASVYLLASVSVERLVAVVFPFYHRYAGNIFYAALIGLPWLLATIAITIYLLTYIFPKLSETIFNDSYLFFIYLPVAVILVAYISIMVKVRFSHIEGLGDETQNMRDRKLAVTLLIVTLTSLVTWLPYNCYYTLLYYGDGRTVYSKDVFFALLQLQYSNSCLNILVYAWRIPEFRSWFREVLVRCTPWKGSHTITIINTKSRAHLSLTSQVHPETTPSCRDSICSTR